MTNLYLIGNGFDKHHDISSGYWDFHDWLKTQDSTLVDQIDELYDYNDDLWGNFEVELGSIDVVGKATEIYQEHPADYGSDHFERTFHEGAIVAGDTIGEIYNKIREKFPEWVKQLKVANSIKEITLQDDAFYITFNYTDTLIDLYKIPLAKILYIHGRAKTSRFLVLGHGKSPSQVQAESEKDFNEDTETAYMQTVEEIERQVNMMRKETKKIIEDNKSVFESFKDVTHVYAYGLSMSDVDKPYFEEIISHINTAKVQWTVDAYGSTPQEVSKAGSVKVAFLQSLGIPQKCISICTLEELRKYKMKPLF